jgi:hypothetical protein
VIVWQESRLFGRLQCFATVLLSFSQAISMPQRPLDSDFPERVEGVGRRHPNRRSCGGHSYGCAADSFLA